MDAVARVDAVADYLAVEGPGPELVLLDVVGRAREEDLVADALGADVGACGGLTSRRRGVGVGALESTCLSPGDATSSAFPSRRRGDGVRFASKAWWWRRVWGEVLCVRRVGAAR